MSNDLFDRTKPDKRGNLSDVRFLSAIAEGAKSTFSMSENQLTNT